MITAKELEATPEIVPNPFWKLESQEIDLFVREWEAANPVKWNEDVLRITE